MSIPRTLKQIYLRIEDELTVIDAADENGIGKIMIPFTPTEWRIIQAAIAKVKAEA